MRLGGDHYKDSHFPLNWLGDSVILSDIPSWHYALHKGNTDTFFLSAVFLLTNPKNLQLLGSRLIMNN